MFMGINKGSLHPKVVTLTWPHWSWKDTLISMALKVVQWTEKVVSTTDRLPRAWEIPGYSYHYEENSPPEAEIFDGITVPSMNPRTWRAGVNYWITKSHVNSLFEENPETLYLWHTAPTVIKKLRQQFQDRVYCVYLHADSNILIARLQERDWMTFDQAATRLAHDPWNIESEINQGTDRRIFDTTITTNKPKEQVLSEFLALLK